MGMGMGMANAALRPPQGEPSCGVSGPFGPLRSRPVTSA